MNPVGGLQTGFSAPTLRSPASIGEADHPAGTSRSVEEETTMLKTISAALLAMSVIAAPALAAETGKTVTPAPVTKSVPVIKSEQLPSKVLNANARMGRHHHKHYRHHRHHKHMGLLKVKAPKHATNHVDGKVAIKHVAPAKRG